MRANVSAEREDCCQIDLEDLRLRSSVCFPVTCVCTRGRKEREGKVPYLIPVLQGELMARVPPLYPAAIQQDVHAMSVLQDRRSQGRYRVLGRQVRRVDSRYAAEFLDEEFGLRVGDVSLFQTD